MTSEMKAFSIHWSTGTGEDKKRGHTMVIRPNIMYALDLFESVFPQRLVDSAFMEAEDVLLTESDD